MKKRAWAWLRCWWHCFWLCDVETLDHRVSSERMRWAGYDYWTTTWIGCSCGVTFYGRRSGR